MALLFSTLGERNNFPLRSGATTFFCIEVIILSNNDNYFYSFSYGKLMGEFANWSSLLFRPWLQNSGSDGALTLKKKKKKKIFLITIFQQKHSIYHSFRDLSKITMVTSVPHQSQAVFSFPKLALK